MKSSDQSPAEDEALRALFRQQYSPIGDDGFSAKVVAALAQPSPPFVIPRSVWALTGAAIGMVIFGGKIATVPHLAAELHVLSDRLRPALSLAAQPDVGLGLAAAIGAILLARFAARAPGLISRSRPLAELLISANARRRP